MPPTVNDAQQSRTSRPRTPPRLIAAVLVLLAAGYALTILVFHPGYITIDASYVYAAAKDWRFGDWQSPAMSIAWWLIDPLAPGRAEHVPAHRHILLGGLRPARAHRGAPLGVACLATPLIALTPPAFVFVGMIWRDVLFGGGLAARRGDDARGGRSPETAAPAGAGVGIARGRLRRAAAAERHLRGRAARRLRGLADALRSKADRDHVRARGRRLLRAHSACLLRDARRQRQNPLHSLLVFDLGGITHFSGENQFPVQWSADETALLTSKCYDPVRWDTYWHMEPCPFVMKRLERKDDMIFGTPRLGRGVAAGGRRPSARLSAPPRDLHVDVPRRLQSRPAVLRLAGTGGDLRQQPLFQAAARPCTTCWQPTVLFRTGFWLVLAIGVCAHRPGRRARHPPEHSPSA